MFKKGDNNYTDVLGRTNRVVEGTKIVGTIHSEADIRLDGYLQGDLTVTGRLVVGPKGVIEGDVNCDNAEVEGSIKGNLNVKEVLVLKSTARIQGDVAIGKLSVEPGAVFMATCSMLGIQED